MNDVKVFENEQFGEVRTLTINNEPWFVALDVCRILGLDKTWNALQRLDDDEKGTTSISTLGGMQEVTIINEAGLYNLVLGSRKKEAKEFRRWVTHDVLPDIRKHGMYATDDLLNDPELAIAVFTALKQEKEERRRLEAVNAAQAQELEAARPKVEFADAVESSDASISVGETAKLLRQNGIDTGEKRFFKWLREHGYLIKNGCDRNLPTQKSMEMGLFEIKESTITLPDGRTRITGTPKVTGKGQRYFIKLFLNPSPAL